MAKEWAAVATDESLAGITLELEDGDPGRDHITRRTVATQGCSEYTIVNRKAGNIKLREITIRVISGIKASLRFGPVSSLYRRRGYVTDIERSSGLKRKIVGGSTCAKL